MAKKSNNHLAYGLTIMIFGLIFLLERTGILRKIPYGESLIGIGSFFLIAGIIFLLTRAEKTLAIVFTAIGIIINANLFWGWMNTYTSLFAPILLIIAGLILILTSKT